MDGRYFVTFSTNTGLTVSVLLDANSAQMTGGFGGWEVVDRPKRVGLTRFKGKNPFRMDVPVLFDGFKDGESQEISIATLARMAEQPGQGQEPPTLTVDGAVPRDDLVWVIEDISWDNQNVMWDSQNGVPVRIRQAAVVHLMQFVDDDILVTAPSPAAQNGGGKPNTSRTVQTGETLKQIAQIVYGDPGKYILILFANSFLDPDPRKIIPSGTILSIPGQNSFKVA